MIDRVRTFARTCAVLLVAAWIPWGAAQTFDPEPGSELLATDAEGRRFVGFGTVDANGVRLELQGPAQELRIVLIGPDGSSTTYRAVWRDGRLRIGPTEATADTEAEPGDGASDGADLADALALAGRGLWIAEDGEEARQIPPTEAVDRDRNDVEADAEPEPGGPHDPDAADPDATDPEDGPEDGPIPPLPPLPPEIDPPDAGPLLDDPSPDRDEERDEEGDDRERREADGDDEDEDEDGDAGDDEEGASDLPLPDVPDLP